MIAVPINDTPYHTEDASTGPADASKSPSAIITLQPLAQPPRPSATPPSTSAPLLSASNAPPRTSAPTSAAPTTSAPASSTSPAPLRSMLPQLPPAAVF